MKLHCQYPVCRNELACNGGNSVQVASRSDLADGDEPDHGMVCQYAALDGLELALLTTHGIDESFDWEQAAHEVLLALLAEHGIGEDFDWSTVLEEQAAAAVAFNKAVEEAKAAGETDVPDPIQVPTSVADLAGR